MGVYADKIVGYIVDVTKEYSEDMWDKYIDVDGLEEKQLSSELINLGFKCYYSRNRPTLDNIMLIYDGMSGKYAKLIYIKSAEYYSNDESEPNSIINEALKTAPVLDEIREKLQKVYTIIFKKNNNINVYFQEFTHWH